MISKRLIRELSCQRLLALEAGRRENLSKARHPWSPWWAEAEAKEAAIREKLRRVELIPHWSPPSPPPACLRYGSLLGPDYYRLVPEPLLHGVPDSERIYGSDYLARHPEMQEQDPVALPLDVQLEASDLTRSILGRGLA